MNDFEFAQRVSTSIGQLYGEAKRSSRQFPRNTLIATRSLASMCCDTMRARDAVEWPKGLDEKIRVLDRSRRINLETRNQLDQLRKWGNAAAHPEASLLDEDEHAALAARALTLAIELLETVFREQSGGAAVPAYDMVDEHPDELREACYRALIENNFVDQHQVALLLQQRLMAKIAEAETHPDAAPQDYRQHLEFRAEEERVLDMLRHASDANHPPALYQYGLALTEGRCGKEKVARGVNLIAMAGRMGEIDAQAWCGRAAMYGMHDEPVDYERARGFLEQASAEDHPLALTLLSVIYRDGLGVEPNARIAYDLTLRAADAGYALAQYEAAVALFDGSGVEPDEEAAFKWLRRASDAGLPEAQYALARSMLAQRITGDRADVDYLLRGAARRVNAANLDLAELNMSQQDHVLWLEAAGRVQGAYEVALKEQCTALAARCKAAAPAIIASLEAALPIMSDALAKDFMLTRFMFDQHGRPYPDRTERMRRMMDATRELMRVRGTGSADEARLLRELGSNMGSLKTQPLARRGPPMALPITHRRAEPVKIGRNATCPCGSGRKYKQCCSRANDELV